MKKDIEGDEQSPGT